MANNPAKDAYLIFIEPFLISKTADLVCSRSRAHRLEGVEGMGHGPGILERHAFLLMPSAPGVGVENFLRLRIVADDQSHMAPVGALGEAFLGNHSQFHAPKERNTLVDGVRDIALKMLEIHGLPEPDF